MTLIVSLAFCGITFGQEYTTHWPDFYSGDFSDYSGLVTYIKINDVFVEEADNYAALELAAFVGTECRGAKFMLWDDDDHPVVQLEVNYNSTGDAVTFQLYDHSTGTLYTDFETSFGEFVTGTDNMQLWWGEDIHINFTGGATPTFEKRILGYGENVNGRTGWYLIASPFEADPDNVTYMTEGNFDLYAFNQSGDAEGKEWINWENEIADYGGFTLYAGEGYLYARENDTTLVFTGEPTTETSVTVDLVYDASEGCEFSGVNLLGNPFGVSAYVDREFYVMNQDHNEIIQAEQGAEIPVLEGIFVVATEEGENVTFSTTPANNTPNPSLALNVVANEGNVIDRAVVSFGKERTLPKFQLNSNSTKVYIPQENRDYAVVTAEEMGEMPVSFKAEKNGSYSLNFTSKEVSFAYLHLIDNKTGKDVDLLESPVYSFNAQTTDYASRFKLVFATGNNSEDNFAFNSNGNWIISNDGEATLQVIDVNGRILSSETISGSCSKAINAAPGVYMLRLINGDNMKVQKVVVK